MTSGVWRLCVFCGSNDGLRPIYATEARRLGVLLARSGVELVYGGASVGLMGRLADAVLGAGGRVIGVIPRSMMDREIGHKGLTDLRLVDSMHERKALMASLSNAFLALPGGLGTLEEIAEMATWSQLGLQKKVCALLNVDGYFDPLLALLDRAVRDGFLREGHRDWIRVSSDSEALLQDLRERAPPPPVHKWMDRGES